jgi:hypothetical protein
MAEMVNFSPPTSLSEEEKQMKAKLSASTAVLSIPEVTWKTRTELSQHFGLKFLANYYFIGLTNNRAHKAKFMAMNAKLAVLISDLEGIKADRREDDRELKLHMEDLVNKRNNLMDAIQNSGINVNQTNMSNEELDQIRFEIKELSHQIEYKNRRYLGNPKEEITLLISKIDEIIYENQDLLYISNTPYEFMDEYLEHRNKICHMAEYMKNAGVLPSQSDKVDEEVYIYARELVDNEKDEKIRDEKNEEKKREIKERDDDFLTQYIVNYEDSSKNDHKVVYIKTHDSLLTDVKRAEEAYTILSRLSTIVNFVQVSIDANDQLPFKAVLLCCNMLILIGEYVWNTILKQELEHMW